MSTKPLGTTVNLIGTSEIAAEYGIPRRLIHKYLEPVIKGDRPYRVNGEHVYFEDDVIAARRQFARDMKRQKDVTLHPEDLKPPEVKKLTENALRLSYLAALQDELGEFSDEYRQMIEAVMSKKELYEGREGPVKSVSYGFAIDKRADAARVSKTLPEDALAKYGILRQEVSVSELEKNGPLIVKKLLTDMISQYKKSHSHSAKAFLDGYQTGLPRKYLERTLAYLEGGKLSETKMGKISREVIETLIKKRVKARRLKVTLNKRTRDRIHGIALPESKRIGYSTPKGLSALLDEIPDG